MLFTSLGRSELGKLSCVSVLSTTIADGGTKDFAHRFSQEDLPVSE